MEKIFCNVVSGLSLTLLVKLGKLTESKEQGKVQMKGKENNKGELSKDRKVGFYHLNNSNG